MKQNYLSFICINILLTHTAKLSGYQTLVQVVWGDIKNWYGRSCGEEFFNFQGSHLLTCTSILFN